MVVRFFGNRYALYRVLCGIDDRQPFYMSLAVLIIFFECRAVGVRFFGNRYALYRVLCRIDDRQPFYMSLAVLIIFFE